MPCGCFGNKKKLKQPTLIDEDKPDSANNKHAKEAGLNDLHNDDPTKTAKKRDVVATHDGDQCALLGYKQTGSRPASSAVDSNSTHTPSTAPLLASTPQSSTGGSPNPPRNSVEAHSRAELQRKRREFFKDLAQTAPRSISSSFYNSSPASFNTLPTQAKARHFGDVKPMRPVSQPSTPAGPEEIEGKAPPGPHLLHSTPVPSAPERSEEGFASKAFLLELKDVSEGISKRWANEDETSPTGLKMRSWPKGEDSTVEGDWVVVPDDEVGVKTTTIVHSVKTVKTSAPAPKELDLSSAPASGEAKHSESPIPSTLVTPPSPPAMGFGEMSSPVNHSIATNDSGIEEQLDEQSPSESWSTNAQKELEGHTETGIHFQQDVPPSVIASLSGAVGELERSDMNFDEGPTVLTYKTESVEVKRTTRVQDGVEEKLEEVTVRVDNSVPKPVQILTQHSYTVSEPDEAEDDRLSDKFDAPCEEVPVKVVEESQFEESSLSQPVGDASYDQTHHHKVENGHFDSSSDQEFKVTCETGIQPTFGEAFVLSNEQALQGEDILRFSVDDGVNVENLTPEQKDLFDEMIRVGEGYANKGFQEQDSDSSSNQAEDTGKEEISDHESSEEVQSQLEKLPEELKQEVEEYTEETERAVRQLSSAAKEDSSFTESEWKQHFEDFDQVVANLDTTTNGSVDIHQVIRGDHPSPLIAGGTTINVASDFDKAFEVKPAGGATISFDTTTVTTVREVSSSDGVVQSDVQTTTTTHKSSPLDLNIEPEEVPISFSIGVKEESQHSENVSGKDEL